MRTSAESPGQLVPEVLQLLGRLTMTAALGCLPATLIGAHAADADCSQAARDGCYLSLQMPGQAGAFHYLASVAAEDRGAAPRDVLIALHGHPHDVRKTFAAASRAVQDAGRATTTVVLAPLFQVAPEHAGDCTSSGTPAAQSGDLLWTCQSWMEGGQAQDSSVSSNQALDALVAQTVRRWPGLRSITVAGFSAGAQMVQHYIGFAAALPAGSPALRYVVADPGTWLYFDAVRTQPMRDGAPISWEQCFDRGGQLDRCTLAMRTIAAADTAACPGLNRWKYGLDNLPATLGRDGVSARAAYGAAEIHYLEGELDSRSGRGTAASVLDRSCGANTQGSYRLQRGVAYASYENALLAPRQRREVAIIPGCAHDVSCVFPHEKARAALLGAP